MSKSALSPPNLHALLIAQKEAATKLKAAEKTIATKTQLLNKRKEKIAAIDRRIDIINKMPSIPGTPFTLHSSSLVKDRKKVTIQIKVDQTTIETKLLAVSELKEILAGIEKQIQAVEKISPKEREHIIIDRPRLKAPKKG
jgi:hypothetical protein